MLQTIRERRLPLEGNGDLDDDVDRHRLLRRRGAGRRGPDGQRRPRDVRGQGGRRQPLPRRHERRRRVRLRHAGPPQLGRPDPPRARRGPLRPLLPADHGARERHDHPVRAAAAHDRRRRRDRHARRLHRHGRALRADPGDRPAGSPRRPSTCSPSTTSASRSTCAASRWATWPSRSSSSGRSPPPASIPAASCSRSPRPPRSPTWSRRAPSPSASRASAAASRWTTSAPASPASTTSSTCRSTTSRSTATSSARSTSSVTDQLVVKSMVDIARGMGMKTIAEFVEAPDDGRDAPREGRRLLPGLLPRRAAPGHRRVREDAAQARPSGGRPMSGSTAPRVRRRARAAGPVRHDQAGQRVLRQPGPRAPDPADAGVPGADDDVLPRHVGRARRERQLVPRRPSRVRPRDRREDRHVARVQGQRRDGVDGQPVREPVRRHAVRRLLRDPGRAAHQRQGDDRRQRRDRGLLVRSSTGFRSRPRWPSSEDTKKSPERWVVVEIDEACTSTAPSTSRICSTRPRTPTAAAAPATCSRPRTRSARGWRRPSRPSRKPVVGEVVLAEATEPVPTHAASGRPLPLPLRK